MGFEILVATRFLRESKIQTILILSGIVVGVSVQVFLSSIINGLQEDIIQKTVGNSSHITLKAMNVEPYPFLEKDGVMVVPKITYSKVEKNIIDYTRIVDDIEMLNKVDEVSPVINEVGFISKNNVSQNVQIKGIEVKRADGIYEISSRLISGGENLTGNNIIIGKGLAEVYGLDINSVILIEAGQGANSYFNVVGIFDFENEQINKSLIFMNLSMAQSFFSMNGSVTGVEMQIGDVFQADDLAKEIAKEFPKFEVTSWQEDNQQLLSALQSQSASSYIIQFFIILSVTLAIASVLAINVVQKSKQIGILKAIGASSKVARRIFVIQGGILGLIGSTLGVLLGIILIEAFVILQSGMENVLFEIGINPKLLVFSIFTATIASVIASLIPARNASKLEPIEVIRNG